MTGPRCTKSNPSWAHQRPFLGFICIKQTKVGKMSSSSRLSKLDDVSLQQSLPCPVCLSQGRRLLTMGHNGPESSTVERRRILRLLSFEPWDLSRLETNYSFPSWLKRPIWPISTACNWRSITCQRWNELAVKYWNWESKTKSHCYQMSQLNTISNLWDQRGKYL